MLVCTAKIPEALAALRCVGRTGGERGGLDIAVRQVLGFPWEKHKPAAIEGEDDRCRHGIGVWSISESYSRRAASRRLRWGSKRETAALRTTEAAGRGC